MATWSPKLPTLSRDVSFYTFTQNLTMGIFPAVSLDTILNINKVNIPVINPLREAIVMTVNINIIFKQTVTAPFTALLNTLVWWPILIDSGTKIGNLKGSALSGRSLFQTLELVSISTGSALLVQDSSMNFNVLITKNIVTDMELGVETQTGTASTTDLFDIESTISYKVVDKVISAKGSYLAII